MRIDLSNLFNNSGDLVKVDYELPLQDYDYCGYKPFVKPIVVKGVIKNNTGVVSIDAVAEYQFNGFCDRCAEPIVKNNTVEIKHFLVTHLNNEDNDDYIVVDDSVLDLDELVTSDVLLSLPYKFLCNENCKGLCAQCGKNLNIEQCDCKKPIDPRLEVLLQLLEEE